MSDLDVEAAVTSVGTVLVVDDDPAICKLVARALGDAGIEVQCASNGSDALEVIESEPVSVVLLDERMPEMSGMEVLDRIRRLPQGRTLPVIFVSGAAELHERVVGLDAGADDYLSKPMEMPDLVARVRTQLRRSAVWSGRVAALEQRLDAVVLLRHIPPEAEPAEIAAAAIDVLMRQAEVNAAGIVAFHGPRAAISLGGGGAWAVGIAAGEPLPPAVARALYLAVQDGPRIEPAHELQGGELALTGLPEMSRDYDLALAPILGPSGTVGVLTIATDPDAEWAFENACLASAIDFAAVLAALLAPELEHGARLVEARGDLEELISTSAFMPVFQPVVELATGVIVGYEALTRWDDGVRPDVRFAEAHTLGLGIETESATMREALHKAAALPPDVWLSLNASPALVLSGALESLLSDVSRPLVVELTEHDEVEDYEALRRAFARLPNVTIAVDDAGAGYASMRHVLDLHPGIVKLDIDWVRNADADPARQSMIAAMLGFAGEMSLQLVAEGIETANELRTLARIGVPLGQGFLFCLPLAASEVPIGVLEPGGMHAGMRHESAGEAPVRPSP